MTQQARRSDLPALTDESAVKRAETLAWINDLIVLAERGDVKALKTIKESAKSVPNLIPRQNVMQNNAEIALFDSIFSDGTQLYARLVAEENLKALKAELAGDNASPLELLLVDRVALCWLDALYCDTLAADQLRHGHTEEQGEYYTRRAERAQRNFLRATRTLATVRRMALPTVQINLAKQQVNMAR